MALIQQEFALNYELTHAVIRITPAGEFKNERGETVKYPCSVRATARNLLEGDIDPLTNFPSVTEQTVVFKFVCDDLTQAGNFARAISSKFAKKEPIYFKASSAVRKADGTSEVTVKDLPVVDDKKIPLTK